MPKTQKEGKQHKMFKHKWKKEKENRTRSKVAKYNTTKPEAQKKQTERTKNCVKRGIMSA